MKNAFTVLELLIAIFIAGILLSSSLSMLHKLVAKNRATAVVNSLVVALYFAKSAAIHNGVNIKFCKSSDHKSCGGNWNDGQIVINEKSNNVLRVMTALATGDKLILNGSFGNDDFVRFTALGTATSGSFIYTPSNDKKHNQVIVVSQTGRIRLQ